MSLTPTAGHFPLYNFTVVTVKVAVLSY